MVTLEYADLDRGSGTGMSFSVIDPAYYRRYFVKKYHIFNPDTGEIIIKSITHISEKNNKEIKSLDLGVGSNTVSYLTGIPSCTLIRKRKPVFSTSNIFYIPSGHDVIARRYTGTHKKYFTRDKMLACELYLPSTLFDSTERITDTVSRGATFKVVTERHKLFLQDYEFTVKANRNETSLDKNKEFLEDLGNISPFSEYRSNPLVTAKVKDQVLLNMKDFLAKYENFKVEN